MLYVSKVLNVVLTLILWSLNKKDHVLEERLFFRYFMHTPYIVQVFVLIPYIVFIFKGVGGIWKESWSLNLYYCSFKQRVWYVLTWSEDILMFIFPYWSIVIDLAIFYDRMSKMETLRLGLSLCFSIKEVFWSNII